MVRLLVTLIFLTYSLGAFAQALCAGVASQSASITDGTRTITFDFDCFTSTYTITMVGPENEWMGILLGTSMSAGSNAFIYCSDNRFVQSTSSGLYSYYIDAQNINRITQTTNFVIGVSSDLVNLGTRTVVSNPRAFDTGGSQEITFTPSTTSVNCPLAYHGGGSMQLAQHTAPGSSFLSAVLDFTGTLPLDIYNFDVGIRQGKVKLDWSIGNVVEVHKMVLQRSLDATKWEDLETFSVANGRDFSYIDDSPYPASNYYRIQVLNDDGSAEYSTVMTVLMPVSQMIEDAIKVTPNPFQNTPNIAVSPGYDLTDLVQVSVMDAAHRDVIKKTMTLNELPDLDLSGLSSGTYYIAVVHSDWLQPIRIVKL